MARTADSRSLYEGVISRVLGFGLLMGGLVEAGQLLSGSGTMHAPAIAAAASMATAALCSVLIARRQREHVEALREAATTDPLTELLNRRGFQDRMELELARAERNGAPLILLALDLDDFKLVNDRLGHLGGDMALERVAGVLRRDLRAVDGVARLGGDEFAIIMPDTHPFEALSAAERIRTRIEQSFENTAATLTASIGVAAFPRDGRSMEELLDAADRAMYRGKALGKNRCCAFKEESAQPVGEVAQLSRP